MTQDKKVRGARVLGSLRRYALRMRLVLAATLLLSLCACVERRLRVATDPPGALIRINGREVGVSPLTWSFEHYGTILIEAELPDRAPARRVFVLKRPGYQYPVVDFFADVAAPWTIRDDHAVMLALPPKRELTEDEVVAEIAGLTERAARARDEVRAVAQDD